MEEKNKMDLNKYITEFLEKEDIERKKEWVIIDLEEVTFQDETKPQITIENQGEQKKMTLNATNTRSLIKLFGPKKEDVISKKITLKIIDTEYKGKAMKGIRIDEEKTKNENSQ